MNTEIKKVISLEEIAKIAEGQIIEIPHWEPGRTINVRLKRINITKDLLATGNLPNILSNALDDVFPKNDAGNKDPNRIDKKKLNENLEKEVTEKLAEDKDTLRQFEELQNKVCKLSLLEPTFEEIEKIMPMTDQQKAAIFEYIVGDIDNLRPFRGERSGDAGTSNNL